MSAGADANSGGTLLYGFHGILDLEEAALRGPSGHIIVVEITELDEKSKFSKVGAW